MESEINITTTSSKFVVGVCVCVCQVDLKRAFISTKSNGRVGDAS